MQGTEGQEWLMLSQHPESLPAHTRALIPENKGDVSLRPAPLQNSEAGVMIMTCKLGALPTKCPMDMSDLCVHHLLCRFPRETDISRVMLSPSGALDPGSPHLHKRRVQVSGHNCSMTWDPQRELFNNSYSCHFPEPSFEPWKSHTLPSPRDVGWNRSFCH